MRNYFDWDTPPDDEPEVEPFFNADAIRDEKKTEVKEKEFINDNTELPF